MNAKSIALHLGIALAGAVVHGVAQYASAKAPSLTAVISAIESALSEAILDASGTVPSKS